jgi:hypothetical protein
MKKHNTKHFIHYLFHVILFWSTTVEVDMIQPYCANFGGTGI